MPPPPLPPFSQGYAVQYIAAIGGLCRKPNADKCVEAYWDICTTRALKTDWSSDALIIEFLCFH